MSGDDDLFRTFLMNMDKFSSDSEDDDEVYKPGDEQSDDDDDDEDPESQDTNQAPPPATDLTNIFHRFDERTRIPLNQMFVTPLPRVHELPKSQFTVAQWDKLRNQCRLHFALLCRSIRFSQYCASGDPILKGIITLIYAFNEIFNTSIDASNNLNEIFGKRIFIPVLGDPDKSVIRSSIHILNHFLNQKTTDDIIEAPYMKEIFRAFQFNGEERPLSFKGISPWSPEEGELLKLAARRFKTPEDIQKFVMPGKSLKVITDKYNEYLLQNHGDDQTQQNKKSKKKDNGQNTPKEDNELFVVRKNMKFTEVNALPPSLAPQ